MNFLQKIKPEFPLRLGFGLMYLYSGYNLIARPTAWHWALPYWLREIITPIVPLDTYLRFQGVFEVLMALVLLSWFMEHAVVKLISFFATLEFVAILIFAFMPFSETNFSITFRDIGLLGGAVALFMMSFTSRNNSSTTTYPSSEVEKLP